MVLQVKIFSLLRLEILYLLSKIFGNFLMQNYFQLHDYFSITQDFQDKSK
jgi:hypothetical protein